VTPPKSTLARPARQRLTTEAELRDVIPAPKPDGFVMRKSLDHLEQHSSRFVELSPMLFIATAGADGRCDSSPRGDQPGFVKILDDRTLLLPDRKGNRRIDTMLNIVSNPHVGLLFIVPGTAETLRVNGRATITSDEELLALCEVEGKRPNLGILVEVEEVFMHCARAFNRSRLWQTETWPERSELATLGTIFRDQLPDLNIDAAEADAALEQANRDLY
jgi:PPOX class probable FMN-dependent enzyme